jgi:hypothetical protein
MAWNLDSRGFANSLGRAVIPLFFCIHLLAMYFVNFPLILKNGDADDFNLWVKTYAAATGLSGHWNMFRGVLRGDFRLLYEGVFENHQALDLPLPFQVKRSFLEENFEDFRMSIFYQHAAWSPEHRQSYEDYLCRVFKNWQGSPLVMIRLSVLSRDFYTPAEARMHQTVMKDELQKSLMETYNCR